MLEFLSVLAVLRVEQYSTVAADPWLTQTTRKVTASASREDHCGENILEAEDDEDKLSETGLF